MSTAKVYLFIFFSIISFLVSGQDRNTPFSTTKNFVGYRIGLGYPFFKNNASSSPFAEGSQVYEFSKAGINYAIHGGGSIGHFFGKAFSISASPFLMYSKFASTNFHYEYISNKTGRILFEQNGEFHLNQFSLFVPLEFNFKINRYIDLTFGVFVVRPFIDIEYDQHIQTDYRFFPPKVYSLQTEVYKRERYNSRSGVHGQFSYLINERNWKKTKLKVEYYHSFSSAGFQVQERWVMIGLTKVFYQ